MRQWLNTFDHVRKTDILLITLMAIGAGCGMIYEYLVAHYAGRILGSVDTAVFGVIGLMIVAMGIGAFYSRTVRCPYTGFAWLETIIAVIGGLSVLAMSAIFALAYVLPLQLQHAYGLHETIDIYGGPIFILKRVAEAFPYITALAIGLFVGMEIPFIARIREQLYAKTLQHNAGTVYGADYIGAGIGAAIWVLVCLKLPLMLSAAMTALLNVVLGCIFLYKFRDKIQYPKILGGINVIVIAILLMVAHNGTNWLNAMNSMLYEDKVVHAQKSKFQNVVLTERRVASTRASVMDLYINGHLQFSTSDEAIYHNMLVAPVLMASARQDHVLIIGGGDGLAARDVLKWNPKSVTLIDLDPQIITLFRGQRTGVAKWLNERLLSLNAASLLDPRVEVIFGDAFKQVEQLVEQGKIYDAIIVDLPDPNHPDLNKLYSDYFYAKLATLLNADGAMVIQSTSPYHSRKAFLSIGLTVSAVGLHVDQYQANVPSFGQWGWTIATVKGLDPKTRILKAQDLPVTLPAISYDFVVAAFAFSDAFYQDIDTIKVNQLTSPTLYIYHSEGWRKNKGIYITQ